MQRWMDGRTDGRMDMMDMMDGRMEWDGDGWGWMVGWSGMEGWGGMGWDGVVGWGWVGWGRMGMEWDGDGGGMGWEGGRAKNTPGNTADNTLKCYREGQNARLFEAEGDIFKRKG